MTFLEIYNASFGSWAPALRVIYLTNLTGQKRHVTKLKWIWPVIVSGDSREIISSPEQRRDVVLSRWHGSKISGWQQTESSLKKWIHNVSIFMDLIQFHLICQMLSNFSGVESERPVSKLRKRKITFSRCVHQLLKAGAWNKYVSCCSRATKCTRRRDELLLLLLLFC